MEGGHTYLRCLDFGWGWPRKGETNSSKIIGGLHNRLLWHVYQWKWKVKVKLLSPVWLFATLWTVAHQAPPSMGFSRQKYWSGLPCPSPGDLPNPRIEPRSPALWADALLSEPPGKRCSKSRSKMPAWLHPCRHRGSALDFFFYSTFLNRGHSWKNRCSLL